MKCHFCAGRGTSRTTFYDEPLTAADFDITEIQNEAYTCNAFQLARVDVGFWIYEAKM